MHKTQIDVYRTTDRGYLVRFYDRELIDLMGTDVLQTPFGADADPKEVYRKLREKHPEKYNIWMHPSCFALNQ
jgi:hypothetical protein